MQKFDDWNKLKKNISKKSSVYTKEGENIGYEQNGKGDNFMRPILVYKKFGKDTIFAIPLSSKEKNGRLFSKIGRIRSNDFQDLKNKFNELIN